MKTADCEDCLAVGWSVKGRDVCMTFALHLACCVKMDDSGSDGSRKSAVTCDAGLIL